MGKNQQGKKVTNKQTSAKPKTLGQRPRAMASIMVQSVISYTNLFIAAVNWNSHIPSHVHKFLFYVIII